MAKTFYNCPLCKKQSAYISEYGMQDSVICKCQGLNEVGRLVNNQYVPHNSQSSLFQNNNPIPPVSKLTGVASSRQPPYIPPSQPILPKGNGNRTGIPGLNPAIQAGDFTVYQLDLDSEVEAAGQYFNNALKSASDRHRYMQMGTIFYAEHSIDENRSLMFYVDKLTREALNFYAKSNVSGQLTDIDQIKVAMRHQNLISN